MLLAAKLLAGCWLVVAIHSFCECTANDGYMYDDHINPVIVYFMQKYNMADCILHQQCCH
jgi:hypothetical protein